MKLRTATLIALMTISVASCKEAEKPKPTPPKPAKVMTVSAAIQHKQRSFPGKVEASTRVNISFQVGGRIARFPVREGEELKKGALIAALDPSEFNYNVNRAQAEFDHKKSQEQRFRTLVKDGYVSKADYDRRKSDYDVATANLKKAKKDLADAVLFAPFDGTIIKKYVKLHQQVKPNEHIVSFQDIRQIDIRLNLPENVIATLKANDNHNIRVSFEALPGKTYAAAVKEFSAEADPETQTFDVILTMPAPKNVNVLPGMTATVRIVIPIDNDNIKNSHLIPVEAVFENQDGQPAVWLVQADNTLRLQPVKTGELIGNQITVIEGIKQGDKIVIAGVHFLKANEKIKPIQGVK